MRIPGCQISCPRCYRQRLCETCFSWQVGWSVFCKMCSVLHRRHQRQWEWPRLGSYSIWRAIHFAIQGCEYCEYNCSITSWYVCITRSRRSSWCVGSRSTSFSGSQGSKSSWQMDFLQEVTTTQVLSPEASGERAFVYHLKRWLYLCLITFMLRCVMRWSHAVIVIYCAYRYHPALACGPRPRARCGLVLSCLERHAL